jgi:hypothetical protein
MRGWVAVLVLGACDPAQDATAPARADLRRIYDLAVEAEPDDLSAVEPDLSRPAEDLSVACPTDLPSYDLVVWPTAPDAAAPSFPVMVQGPGPVVAHMQAWTVVWAGDEAVGATVAQFLGWMLASDYWQILSQYGVGPGDSRGVVVLPSSVPYQAGLVISAVLARIPSFDDDTALFIVPPKGVWLDPSSAYHAFASVAYAVILQQDQAPRTLDDMTYYVSHEAAELATDPRLNGNAGWYLPPGPPNRTEVADACRPSARWSGGPDGGAPYLVARLYSNTAALSRTSYPCGPDPPPLFGVAFAPRLLLAPFVSAACATSGVALVRCRPFSAVGDVSLHWQASTTPDCRLGASSGDAQPGVDFFLTVSSSQTGQCAIWLSVSEPGPGTTLQTGTLVSLSN